DEQRALQQAFGRCLTAASALRWLVIMCGGPGTGKSTLIDTVAGTLGRLAQHIQYNALRRQRRGGSSPSPEIAKLRGAKLVFANEGGGNLPLDTELVKQMTGGDSMSARFCYENDVTFRAKFLVALVSNAPPRLP